MPPILDVAIGTVFIFLLFSLVVTALNEVILSRFDQRAKFLHMGLQELFGEANDAENRAWRKKWWVLLSGGLFSSVKLAGMTKQLCEHGLINAFSRTDKAEGSSPSYIPAGSFVTALLDIACKQSIAPTLDANAGKTTDANAANKTDANAVSNTDATAGKITDTSPDMTQLEHSAVNIEKWIRAIPQPKLKESLLSLFLMAGKDVVKFKVAVEGWFNSSMDRVAGWYKRFAQKWMIVIAFVLAAVLNVDTIHIVRELSVSPNLAKAVASQAESYVKSDVRPMTEEAAREAARARVEEARTALRVANEKNDATAIANAKKALAAAEEAGDADAKFRAAINRLSSTGIPIGWDDAQRKALGIDGLRFSLRQSLSLILKPSRWLDLAAGFMAWFSPHVFVLIALVAGWFLTALAASFGAPFWFDTLNRFINLRNAGRPPGETDPTSTSTKPPPANLDKTPGVPVAAAL
jgi:hypothetical protein